MLRLSLDYRFGHGSTCARDHMHNFSHCLVDIVLYPKSLCLFIRGHISYAFYTYVFREQMVPNRSSKGPRKDDLLMFLALPLEIYRGLDWQLLGIYALCVTQMHAENLSSGGTFLSANVFF